MAGYLIVNFKITDPEEYEQYIAAVVPMFEKYDARILVGADECDVLEGSWPEGRTVVVEFPSMARAREWYDSPEYQGPKAIRQRTTTDTQAILVDGFVMPVE